MTGAAPYEHEATKQCQGGGAAKDQSPAALTTHHAPRIPTADKRNSYMSDHAHAEHATRPRLGNEKVTYGDQDEMVTR